MWKEFFYFNKSERRAVILLTAVLAVSAATAWLLPRNRKESNPSCSQEIIDRFDAYTAAIVQENGRHSKRQMETTVCLEPFDPNTASEERFLHLGLPRWMAQNIVKYRAKGGVFRKADDFKKIYGMTEDTYNTLRPYIYIGADFTAQRSQRPSSNAAPTTKQEEQSLLIENDSTSPHSNVLAKSGLSTRTIKYAPGTMIELNRADTTELKRIPGIGSVTARRIAQYRYKLGGFYTPRQLLEIDESYEKLLPWFQTDTSLIRPIEVNKASIERLMHHPYLNFYQAKAIDEHRKNRGAFKNLQELSMYDEFSEQDIARLKPYLLF